jgi:hypothetical protein
MFLSERRFRTTYQSQSSTVWYEWVYTLFKENKAKEKAIRRLTFQTSIDHWFSLTSPYRPGLKRRTWPFNCSSDTEISLRIYRIKICNSITYSMYMSKLYQGLRRVHACFLTKRLKTQVHYSSNTAPPGTLGNLFIQAMKTVNNLAANLQDRSTLVQWGTEKFYEAFRAYVRSWVKNTTHMWRWAVVPRGAN